jgi:heat shock protein HslJ
MKKIFTSTAILIFTLILTGQTFAQLSGEWTLTKMVRDTFEVRLSQDAKAPTLKFGDERLSGNGGCNSYGAGYKTEGDKGFKAGPVMSTKMACMRPDANKQESAYFDTLDRADSYRITGNTLMLSGNGGAYSLTFRRLGGIKSRPFLWIVDKKMVDCQGIVHQNCMQVKKTDIAEWEILRAPIAGFKYRPGRYYLLRVQQTADGYKLVKIVSRTRLMPHVD